MAPTFTERSLILVMRVATESTIGLADLAEEAGVNVSTTWRWATVGVKGVKLETMLIGGRRRTSHEAYGRFLASINSGKVVTTKQRLKAIEAAEREADMLGL